MSPTGEDHPIYNLLRLQRDVGAQSRLGMVYTDRVVGSDYNRVAGVGCAAAVRRGVQRAAPARREPDPDRRRHHDRAALVRPLRSGTAAPSVARLGTDASDPDFRARSGFFPRPGLSHANFQPRVTLYGRPGSFIES